MIKEPKSILDLLRPDRSITPETIRLMIALLEVPPSSARGDPTPPRTDDDPRTRIAALS